MTIQRHIGMTCLERCQQRNNCGCIMPQQYSRKRLLAAAAPTRIPTQHARFANMVGMYFSEMPCKHASFARTLDETRFSRFHEAMLDRGILLPASATACYHVCAAHTAEQIDRCLETFARVGRELGVIQP